MPHLFRSYRHPRRNYLDLQERNPESEINYPIWQVARATSAAPLYFKAVEMKPDDKDSEFIDGGFGANNPSEEVYQSVGQLSNSQRGAIATLVSIGTGKSSKRGSNPKAGYGLYRHYANIAIKWASQSEATHVRMDGRTRSDNTDYFRLNVEEGLGKVKLDTWKGRKGDQTLKLIRTKTTDYLQSEDVKAIIRTVAESLVRTRRSRASQTNSDQWERFCHGVEYACHVNGCNHGERIAKREDLRQHLQKEHSLENESEISNLLDRGKYFRLFLTRM